MKIPLLVLILFSSTFAFGQTPVVTGVSPASGPTSGGTQVTITGSGFSSECVPHYNCGFPKVFFGLVEAPSVQLVNETTLVVTTPKNLPITTVVKVVNAVASSAPGAGFTFQGEVPDTFVRFLLPTFTGPVRGANGSEFHTEFRARISGEYVWPVHIFGLAPTENDPLVLTEAIGPHDVLYRGAPARFLYIPVADVRSFSPNLRVYDITRDAENYGTEMPVVHEREFTRDELAMQGVPTDSRFRNTLRIYNSRFLPLVVVVTINGDERTERLIPVPAATGIYNPGVAALSDFPRDIGPMTVTVAQPPPMPPYDFREEIWAFMTVTNNETQLITTVTPRVY